MISELDETIKQLLIKEGKVDPATVDIDFQTPDREWSASVSKPTINVYLYDIRENHQLRGTEFAITRDDNGNATRKKNPSRIDLSYLITVWTSDIVDEHHLLWHVLVTLFRYPELPEEVLSEQILLQGYPIKTLTAQPNGLFNNPADFWSALDNEIKPAINYVVTVPLDVAVEFTAPMVREKILGFKPPDADAERLVQITGIVHRAGQPTQGIPEAKVVAKEAGMTAVTDEQGRYYLSKLSAGKHTLEVLITGKKVRETSVSIPGASYDIEV
jgi:hypothetical protein